MFPTPRFSTASISRQIAALEEHLGARLLQRTTRRLSMSEPGRAFYERAQQILTDIAETEAVIGSASTQPNGLLRVSVPLSYGLREFSRPKAITRQRFALPMPLTSFERQPASVDLLVKAVTAIHGRRKGFPGRPR